jgi:hypothetical protein
MSHDPLMLWHLAREQNRATERRVSRGATRSAARQQMSRRARTRRTED